MDAPKKTWTRDEVIAHLERYERHLEQSIERRRAVNALLAGRPPERPKLRVIRGDKQA
jgi:hypothetical protein